MAPLAVAGHGRRPTHGFALADWMIAMTTSRVDKPSTSQNPASSPTGRGRIGRVVAGSLATGLVAALLLVAAPFIPAQESAVTGAVLCGFALGGAMLAELSVGVADPPQRWAAAPPCSWGWAVFCCWFSVPRWTGCWTGCGPPPCWRW